MVEDIDLRKSIQKVLLLSVFKSFCEKNRTAEQQARIRNIYSHSTSKIETTKNLIANEVNEDLTTEDCEKLLPLIQAFLNKKSFRKNVLESTKVSLLKKQKYRCAICGYNVNIHSPVDHIVPFKYVGDELENNYQFLCINCNSKKNASIDYQIRYLLRTL